LFCSLRVAGQNN